MLLLLRKIIINSSSEAQELHWPGRHKTQNGWICPSKRLQTGSFHPLTTRLTGGENSSHTLSKTCICTGTFRKTHTPLQWYLNSEGVCYSVPVLPSGCVASSGTNMAAPVTLQTQFLSSNYWWLHLTACNYLSLGNRCQSLRSGAG